MPENKRSRWWECCGSRIAGVSPASYGGSRKRGRDARDPSRSAATICGLLITFIWASLCYAGQPVIWETAGRGDLLKGDARGVSISDTGLLTLAPRITEVFNTEQAFIWSTAVDSQGNIYLGTGHD